MTQIEQIKDEIKRLRRKNYIDADNGCNEDECYGYELCLDNILSFIESLEKEQSQGLDEAATKYQLEVDKQWNRGWSDSVEQAYVEGVNDVIGTSIGDAFKAGAKWRDSQIPRLSNNIDEAAEEYAYNEYPSYGVANVECEKHFRAGAEWRDSQIPRLPNNIDEAELKYVESSNIPPANQEEEMMVHDAFKAGAKWRDEQITKLPDNIHKAAVQFAQRAYSPFDDPYEMSREFENDVACFEAGAKWALEQTKMEE